MSQTEFYADLILPVPLDQHFTYRIPDYLKNECSKGKRAVVQFGKKKIYSAIIKNVHQNCPPDINVKDIIDILDSTPLVTDTQLSFWDWMAEYYMSTIGEVYKAALPSGLRLESNTSVEYNASFFEENELPDFSQKESLVLDALKPGKPLNLEDINRILMVKNCMPFIKSLFEKGTIKIEESIEKGFQQKTEKYICLSLQYAGNEKLNVLIEKLKRAPKQLDLLTSYLDLSNYEENVLPKPISQKLLVKKNQIQAGILNSLIKKGIFEIRNENVSRHSSTQHTETNLLKPLNDFQQNALDQINTLFNEKGTVLLHGITSSGKTEIYIQLIDSYLKENKQVLYLLPEIALTTQIIERLRQAFGTKVGIYHSKFSDAERVETYNNILGIDMKDNAIPFQLILGVRSSIFLPFKNLGLIIVDEEHESSYKQYNPSPRYQARDSAIMLANLSGAKTLLGTATPSVESFYNAKSGKFGLVSVNQRFMGISLPEVIIADVKEARRKKQMKSHFTPALLYQIEIALRQGEQVILFQNRRGFALYLECFECGWIPKCKYCDVSLTYHRYTNQLVCHYCGYSHNVVDKCSNCHSTDIRTRGFGTEKIEEDLQIFFPEAKIKRLDLDSSRGKNAHSSIISDFENHRIDILVGTQMITKGLDFDNVSLVGILDANQMLNFPDFRAYERSFQLMAQVGGRAGRKIKQGKVIIQTISSENLIIQQVAKNDYENMFNTQLNERKQFRYPPFNRLINISLKHKNKAILDKAAIVYAKALRLLPELEIIGPEYPVIGRIYDFYYKNILIKLKKVNRINDFKKFIRETGKQLLKNDEFKGVQIIYDVDPY
jgi:primosomal protein N' (replication factor Y)